MQGGDAQNVRPLPAYICQRSARELVLANPDIAQQPLRF